MIKYLLKIKKLWLWSAFLVVLFTACEKDSKVNNSSAPKQFVDEKSAFEKAKQKIPRYYNCFHFLKVRDIPSGILRHFTIPTKQNCLKNY